MAEESNEQTEAAGKEDKSAKKSTAKKPKTAKAKKAPAKAAAKSKTKKAPAKAKAAAKPKAKKAPAKAKAAAKPKAKKAPAKAKATKAPAAKTAKAEKTPAAEAAKPAVKNGKSKQASSPKKTLQNVHLVTGFPGFIGRRLVDEVLRTQPDSTVVALVQPQMVGHAKKAVSNLSDENASSRVELVVGDITQPKLGIEPSTYASLLERVGTVWHLAAIYDLAVDEQVAYRVNVVGTSHILDFCEELRNLVRLNYVSTCYVAGERDGLVLESELDVGQGHKNHYESTKFWAELEVQRRWGTLPTSIFRPGIVVGDSKTGATDKYDGPYFLINLLLRMPSWLPMVNVGQGDATVNLVPVDYVVDAMIAIGSKAGTTGKVFQLGDPNPMRAKDLISLLLQRLGRRQAIGTIPSSIFEGALGVAPIRRLIGIPKESVIYFNHPVRFDVSATLDALEGTGIRCPHFSDYATTMLDYMKRNPDKGFLDNRRI